MTGAQVYSGPVSLWILRPIKKCFIKNLILMKQQISKVQKQHDDEVKPSKCLFETHTHTHINSICVVSPDDEDDDEDDEDDIFTVTCSSSSPLF